VFLKEQRDLPARFDIIIRFALLPYVLLTPFLTFFSRVDLSSAKPRTPSTHSVLEYGSQANALLAQLASTLRRGLGNRTKAVAILHRTSEVRSISQAHPSHPNIIHIGLILNPEHASRLVDQGPAADDPDPSHAEQFRDFWGEKAELRRFKDGRIIESVVWDVKTSDERAHVPSMVVQYLLGRHFGVIVDAIQTWQTAFDSTLRLPESVAMLHQGSANGSSGFKGAMTAFDQLVMGLKALDDELPLSLVNVSPVSEYLRYTSVFSPVALPPRLGASMPQCWSYFPAMEIILEFEKSGRWPDDLRAIQKIKLALFERVASALMNSKEGLKATVVVGDAVVYSDIQDQSRLEIVTAEGWAFSARIWHDREATLLDRIIDNKPQFSIASQKPDEDRSKERQEALEAKTSYTRRFIHAPRHHRAIASLCHRFSAYAGTVRLVKRWLASHWLLHGHVREEVVEIICAAFFVGDGRIPEAGNVGEERATVPGSKERGFATVVEFLKDWTWEDRLFVPLYSSSENGDDGATATTRAKLGVWRVSTEEDRAGHVWTSDGPDIMAAHRVRAIAKATWDYLVRMETGSIDVKECLHAINVALYLTSGTHRDYSSIQLKTMTSSSNSNLPSYRVISRMWT
jgi:U3 small nucleolar RNA-associated protein 22